MLNNLYLIYAFVIGSIFASFSSAVAWRTGNHPHKHDLKDKRYSVIFGRSMCPNCEKTLPWWALIPVLSYIFLSGKCFNCKKHYSIFYFLIEIISGIFCVLVLKNYFDGIFNLYFSLLLVFAYFILIILSFQDIWFEEISDRIALFGIGSILLVQIIYGFLNSNPGYVLNYILISLIVFVIFAALVVFTNSMGGGDLRAFAVITLIFDFQNVLLIFTIAFIAATLGGLIQAFIKKKNISKLHIRLIPYMTLGVFIMSVFGTEIIKIVFGI